MQLVSLKKIRHFLHLTNKAQRNRSAHNKRVTVFKSEDDFWMLLSVRAIVTIIVVIIVVEKK